MNHSEKHDLYNSWDLAQDEEEVGDVRMTQVDALGHGLRLDQFLASWFGESSRSYLQELILRGRVCISGVQQKSPAKRLSVRQWISVDWVPPQHSLPYVAQAMPLDIIDEDEHLMIINKPAGLVVHPAAGNWSGTLLNGLLAYHSNAFDLARAGIVHRLDKDTSGLMVVGKTVACVAALSLLIAQRKVQRQYLAIATGMMANPYLSIEAPIGRDKSIRTRMAICSSGKPARTDIECLWHADLEQASFCGVRASLHTGRTHQIRVHMAYRGCPLVSDTVYGGKVALGLARQALHAVKLSFVHPITKELKSWCSMPPVDFVSAWNLACPPGVVNYLKTMS